MCNGFDRRYSYLIFLFVVAIIITSLWSLTYGLQDMRVLQQFTWEHGFNKEINLLLFQFRLPRILIAGLVGMALGIAGAVLQGLSRNGLADPGILGINAGAGLAILFFMYFSNMGMMSSNGYSIVILPFCGLIGGLGTAVVVYRLSCVRGTLDTHRFLLVGMAMGIGISAISIYLSLKMSPADFHLVMIWSTGTIMYFDWKHILSILPWCMILVPFLCSKAYLLDLFQLDESIVKSLGIRVDKERSTLLLGSAGLISASVCVAGNISFVGLLIPHIARALVGHRHQQMLPACGLLGILFVILADCIAQNIFAPAQVAVGIVMSMIGVPYFIFLLYKVNR